MRLVLALSPARSGILSPSRRASEVAVGKAGHLRSQPGDTKAYRERLQGCLQLQRAGDGQDRGRGGEALGRDAAFRALNSGNRTHRMGEALIFYHEEE